jgi:hypothetical protein
VAIFEVRGPAQEQAQQGMVESFKNVYTLYTGAQWHDCIRAAEAHLKQWTDIPATIILKRAQHYHEHPTEWRGYHIAEGK